MLVILLYCDTSAIYVGVVFLQSKSDRLDFLFYIGIPGYYIGEGFTGKSYGS